jgi:hypothetical protein
MTSATLFSGPAVGELADDVEVTNVPGVLLEQVEQDPLKRRRIGSIPPLAGFAYVSKIVRFDDGSAARCLGV